MNNKLTFYRKLYKIRRSVPVVDTIGESEINTLKNMFGEDFFRTIEPCEHDNHMYRVTYADRWQDVECYTDMGKRSDQKVSCKITVDLEDCEVTEVPQLQAEEVDTNDF